MANNSGLHVLAAALNKRNRRHFGLDNGFGKPISVGFHAVATATGLRVEYLEDVEEAIHVYDLAYLGFKFVDNTEPTTHNGMISYIENYRFADGSSLAVVVSCPEDFEK